MDSGIDWLESVIWMVPQESIPPELLEEMRAAMSALFGASEKLVEARQRFVALGERYCKQQNSERVKRDLGQILEGLSMAHAVLQGTN